MITEVKRKSLDIKYSGRSSDYITPSFGFGCLYKCAYCYMRRHNPNGLNIAVNVDDILNSVIYHHNNLPHKESNQTHNSLWTYDISCNEDFSLHLKYHKWEYILNKLIDNNIFPTFATKHVNKKLLDFNPEFKARIRFSLMPQELSDILEPNTSKIIDRIKGINDFINAGWDVHINFSPVIIKSGTKNMYENLFKLINDIVLDEYKPRVKAEVIMLTHNEKMHILNLDENPEAEELLWDEDRQEVKVSSYGSVNLRYNRFKKYKYINQFKALHNSIISWNEIRYIF